MKKFYEFGDIHFSSINPWSQLVGDKFIDWFDKTDFGDKDDIEIGFAGDIAERDVNPGKVVDQIDRLFNIASNKFKHVYVTVGNHDKKLYHDVEQHSLYFLENKKNVTVVDKMQELKSQNGFDILFMPHQRFDNIELTDYYNALPDTVYNKSYDIVFGHWAIKNEKGLDYMKKGVDITKFKDVKSFAIGHVHLRVMPEYLGSIWPNSTVEYDTNRPHGYKVLDEDRKESFVEFPEFLAYKEINLGDSVTDNPDTVTVYTVKNCNSMLEAVSKYPNLYIKDIERPQSSTSDLELSTDTVKSVAIGYINDIPKAFDDMIKETNMTIGRPVYSLCKKLLSTTGTV